MENRVETLLNALVNGETIDFNPQSRIEEYLKNCINKTGVEGLPAPQSRIDALLYRLAEVIPSGGGTSSGMTMREFLGARDGQYLFYGAGLLTYEHIESIFSYSDTESITTMYNMFANCTALTSVPQFDTRNVTNMSNMFDRCKELTSVPQFDTRNVTNMTTMFYYCSKLTSVPQFDTRNVTNMYNMFGNCAALTSVPEFDTRNVTNMSKMFDRCKKLTSVPEFDTRNVTNISDMFYYCSKLTAVPQFDTCNVTNMSNMFDSCEELTSVPQFDTRNVTNMSKMFYDCVALTSVPEFDTRNVTNMSYMFATCKALTSLKLKNLRVNTQIGSGTTWGHLINVDDLIFMIYHLRDTGSTKTFTVGSANLEKLASVYVRTIDITDEMRAEDDLIDEKLPFAVCESTDEGATLITDYVLGKNWSIQ